jgi:hypothetical protein
MRYFLVAALVLLTVANANALTKEAARVEPGATPYGLASDCVLSAYNWCSGWIWVFSDDPGAVWGTVYDPNICGCDPDKGAVDQVVLYSRCASVPGDLGGIDVETVDSRNCLVDLLYHSGPFTVTHCVSGDRWTTIPVPLIHVNHNPFAITVEWGLANNPQLATDNAVGNFYCARGYTGFPGCATIGFTCTGWVNLPQVTYIYLTDLDNNGTLEDLCLLYGAPYGPSFPYIYYYGYMNNNLVMIVGVDTLAPTAVEPSSWGHVKALYN